MDFEFLSARMLELLWRASWQATVLASLVLVAQWCFAGRLAPPWRYALWLLVVARLLVPVTPSSSWSVYNLGWTRHLSSSPQQTKPLEKGPALAEEPSSEQGHSAGHIAAQPQSLSKPTTGPTAPALGPAPRQLSLGVPVGWAQRHLAAIWLAGVALLGMRLAWGNYLFGLQLRRRPALNDASVLRLWDACRKEMGVRRQLAMVVVPEVESPALFGCFRLKLLLPEQITTRFSHQELRHVFLHELAHVRRGDAMVNWLTTILQTIHWFNPVLGWAFHRMRVDRELACDALALSHARDGEARPYGQTVIKVLQGFTRPVVIPGLVGILEDKQQIKERITMIAQFKPSSGWPVLAVALLSLLGCVSLTDARRDPSPAAVAAHHSQHLPDAAPAGAGQFRAPRLEQLPADKLGEGILDERMRPSPDGKSLAFVNWANGNLVLCDVASGQSRELTTDATWEVPNQYCDSMLWSRDGAQIAYSWTKGDSGELRLVPRTGGKPRTVVTFPGQAFFPQAWSSDGRFILGMLTESPGARKTRMARVDVPAGRWTVVKELPDSAGWPTLTLAPDGQRVVYDSPKGELRLIHVDGSGDRVVVDNPADDRTPVWTPDGRNVLFLSDRLGRYALWAIPFRDGLPSGEEILVRDGFANANAADLLGCTDDGTLYWYTATPRGNVFEAAVDFNAGTLQAPTQVSLRFDGRNRHPVWSADGSKLAYIARFLGPRTRPWSCGRLPRAKNSM